MDDTFVVDDREKSGGNGSARDEKESADPQKRGDVCHRRRRQVRWERVGQRHGLRGFAKRLLVVVYVVVDVQLLVAVVPERVEEVDVSSACEGLM